MIKANKMDRSTVVRILSESFDANPSVNYIVRQDSLRTERIACLMGYSFNTCLDFGSAYLSEDRRCCALVLFPEKKRLSFSSVVRDLRLVFGVIGLAGVSRVLKREGLIKARYPSDKRIYYIWFIGCSPADQAKGLGSTMMDFLLAEADQLGLPVYLETSVKRNLAWYGRLGFQVYDQLDNGYTLYFLRKSNSTL